MLPVKTTNRSANKYQLAKHNRGITLLTLTKYKDSIRNVALD